MKRHSLYLTLCFIISMVAMGCSDGSNTITPERTGIFARYTVTYNSSNPYNWYGEQHNAGLAYGFASTPFTQMTTNKAADITANFIIGIPEGGLLDIVNDFGAEDYSQLVDFVHQTEAYDGMTVGQLLDQLELNSTQRTYMSRVFDAIEIVATDPDAAIAEMNNIENTVLTSALTDEQRACPLMLLSIAKHSADYWLNDPNSGVPAGELGRIRDIINRDSKGCLKGTIVGIATGGVNGFFGGSALGPAHSLPGAVGGAIMGGIIGGLGGAIAGSLFGG